jgi:hypothetical protein
LSSTGLPNSYAKQISRSKAFQRNIGNAITRVNSTGGFAKLYGGGRAGQIAVGGTVISAAFIVLTTTANAYAAEKGNWHDAAGGNPGRAYTNNPDDLGCCECAELSRTVIVYPWPCSMWNDPIVNAATQDTNYSSYGETDAKECALNERVFSSEYQGQQFGGHIYIKKLRRCRWKGMD